jgi:hypothetical protein
MSNKCNLHKQIIDNLGETISALKAENEKLTKENEKLSLDVQIYFPFQEIAEKLKAENEGLKDCLLTRDYAIKEYKAENVALKADNKSYKKINEYLKEENKRLEASPNPVSVEDIERVIMDLGYVNMALQVAIAVHDRIYGKDKLEEFKRNFDAWQKSKNDKPKEYTNNKYEKWDYIDFGYRRLRVSGLSATEMVRLVVEKLPEEGSMEVWGLKITKDKPKEYCETEGDLVCFIDTETNTRLYPAKGIAPKITDFSKVKCIISQLKPIKTEKIVSLEDICLPFTYNEYNKLSGIVIPKEIIKWLIHRFNERG